MAGQHHHPLGNVVAIKRTSLLMDTTAIAGVHPIGLVEAQPGPYVLHVKMFASTTLHSSLNVLCLNNNRFSAMAAWRTATGAGVAKRLLDPAPVLWLRSGGNVLELVTKYLMPVSILSITTGYSREA